MNNETWNGWNLDNLRKLRDSIEGYGSEKINMDWVYTIQKCPLGYMDDEDLPDINLNQCNTTGDIFGHAAFIMRKDRIEYIHENDVIRWLGLPDYSLSCREKWKWFLHQYLDKDIDPPCGSKSDYDAVLEMLDIIIRHIEDDEMKTEKRLRNPFEVKESKNGIWMVNVKDGDTVPSYLLPRYLFRDKELAESYTVKLYNSYINYIESKYRLGD